MSDYQREKQIVRGFTDAFDGAPIKDQSNVVKAFTLPNYQWRGMHPFYELSGVDAVVDEFWAPLQTCVKHIQRREDIFFAGQNVYASEPQVWTCSMGHFMGLFDEDWLGIPATRKMVFLPYAEFHRVDENGKIAESALFIDIIRIMQQAGIDPFPRQTATAIIQPGPQIHDGILLDPAKAQDTKKSLDLVERMVADLTELNTTGNDRCAPEVLARTWHDNMSWYGPAGIGAAYTIPRYQEQHQYPFREQLTDKVFNGHVTRIGEGNYVGWFGWPNLNNKNKGGFLGLPASDIHAEMRVVDIYRRDGDKLAENWVFIDILYYLIQHGVDLLKHPNAIRELHGDAQT